MGKRRRGDVGDRYDTSYRTKDVGGSRRGVLTKNLPENISFFKFSTKEAKRIIIVTYEIKTKNHNLVAEGKKEVGDWDYVYEYFVHRYIGASNSDYICPTTFGKRCLICEQQKEYFKSGDKEEAEALRAQRRVFYNIVDVNDIGKGIQILDISHDWFERKLIKEAQDATEGKGYVRFADVDEGEVIKVRCEENHYNGKVQAKPDRIDFLDRSKYLTVDEVDAFLDEAISFDDCIEVKSYEELEEILYAEKPVKEESKNSREDDDEDEDDRGSRRKRKEKDDDEGSKKSRRRSRDDDEDDEDDEPRSRRKRKEKDDKCPYDHEFGKDHDKYPKDCDKCKVWEDCEDAK